MRARIPKWLQTLLQITISAGLIALVLRQIDLGLASTLLLRVRQIAWVVPMLLAALVLFNASKIASAYRSNAYQRHRAIYVGQGYNLRLYYAGMFLNLFLPGGIGGDGYKILVLRRHLAAPVMTLLQIALADRANGLLILLMLSCWLWILPTAVLPPMLTNVISPVLLFAGSAVLLLAAFIAGHRRFLGMNADLIFRLFGYGLAVQLLQLGCMTLLLLTLQVQPVELVPYLAVFLLSSIAAVLPLSVGGLGVRELTFLYGMKMLALDPVPGVLASSGFFMITLASSLIGVVFLRRFAAPLN